MKLSDDLQKILAKKYEPSTMVEMKYKGYDLAFKTDGDGNPILLFMGKKNKEGIIRGERFARTLKYDREGKPIKDYWDLKGKAT